MKSHTYITGSILLVIAMLIAVDTSYGLLLGASALSMFLFSLCAGILLALFAMIERVVRVVVRTMRGRIGLAPQTTTAHQ